MSSDVNERKPLDHGGNSVHLAPHVAVGQGRTSSKLHSYWDSGAGRSGMGNVSYSHYTADATELAAFVEGITGRRLHSSTFQLSVSAFRGRGGALMAWLGGVCVGCLGCQGVFRVCFCGRHGLG
jgi:hypothetical protein